MDADQYERCIERLETKIEESNRLIRKLVLALEIIRNHPNASEYIFNTAEEAIAKAKEQGYGVII